VFTAWGIGGFLLAKLAGSLYVKTQSFNSAYIMASVLLVIAAIMVWFVKEPNHMEKAKSEEEE